MNTAEQIDPVIERLGRVLESGSLPPPYDRWGARLLAHLTKPVQVVVTGLEGSGKSALIEMMSAQPVIGPNVRVPVLELAYGETERALIERQDGSVSTFMGFLKDCDCPENAVRARQELPDPRLIQQDFIEIGLVGSPAQKQATLEVAMARADVMIWCSQNFGEEEQRLWSMVPDQIKDHSLLTLTMADRQLMRGVLTENIANLEHIVAEEFLGLFPVATIQGITARTAAQCVNDELWLSSGGKHLMDLVSRQVRQGRSADVDQARIFMDRLSARLPQVSSEPDAEALSEMPSKVEPAPEPAYQESAIPFEVIPHDSKAVAVLTEAVDLLQQHASHMLDEVNDDQEIDTDFILNGCSDAIASVTGLLDTAGDDAATGAIQEDLQEGEEMLVLFQLERGEEAALDAVTLLLQIRKELIEKLAV